MPISASEIIYVLAVLAIGAYALIRVLRFLHASRSARLKQVERRRRFDVIRTETPLDHPNEVALERGVESIETHFSVLRRLLVPLIVGATLVLAAIPFIAATSASSATVVAAVTAALVGLALRPFLENAFAGLVISSSRLVRIGDTVRLDDCYGTVEDITVTHTTIKAWDWRRYLVPNGRMLESTFFNYSLFDTYQWAYVEFFVAPDADLDEVARIAVEVPTRSKFFSGSEKPKFWVMRIEKDTVCCWVAAWANSASDAWALSHDIRTDLLRELRTRGLPLSLQRLAITPQAGGLGMNPGSRPK